MSKLLSPLPIALSLLVATAIWAETSPPNIEKALEVQRQLVLERPGDATAHNDLGNLLSLTGRVGEAETAYQTAKRLDAVSIPARFNLGLLFQQTGRLEEANQEFYSLLEIEPRNAWAHYQLGAVAFAQGKRKQARELYARSFALDPTLSFPRNNPHVIDNPLATEALLMSTRYLDNPTARVPRQYAEAARIAELMLEVEKKATDGPEKAAEEKGAEEPPNPSEELLEGGSEGDEKSRVLTNEDLEDLGQVGQAGGRNVRRGSRSQGASRYSTSGRGGDSGREGVREQDPRSRYRPRSSGADNRAQEDSGRGGNTVGGFTTLGRVDEGNTLEEGEAGVPSNPGTVLRPQIGQPRPGTVVPGRPGGNSGGRGLEPYRPGTGSTARVALELLDDEAVGP